MSLFPRETRPITKEIAFLIIRMLLQEDAVVLISKIDNR